MPTCVLSGGIDAEIVAKPNPSPSGRGCSTSTAQRTWKTGSAPRVRYCHRALELEGMIRGGGGGAGAAAAVAHQLMQNPLVGAVVVLVLVVTAWWLWNKYF